MAESLENIQQQFNETRKEIAGIYTELKQRMIEGRDDSNKSAKRFRLLWWVYGGFAAALALVYIVLGFTGAPLYLIFAVIWAGFSFVAFKYLAPGTYKQFKGFALWYEAEVQVLDKEIEALNG